MISIIIPTYNRADMIIESIQSVLDQTYQNIEVIIVDNGSEDETVLKVQQLGDPRIRVCIERKRGAAYARNTGVRQAAGTVFAFLDSDDLWAPQKLMLQMKQLKEAGSGAMLFTEFREFHSDQPYGVLQRGEMSMSLSIITLMIRKSDFMQVGYFNAALQTGEFMEWYARAVDLGLKTAKVSDVMTFRRIHAGNTASSARTGIDYINACRAILVRRNSKRQPG